VASGAAGGGSGRHLDACQEVHTEQVLSASNATQPIPGACCCE
jgi:hypothetical protein